MKLSVLFSLTTIASAQILNTDSNAFGASILRGVLTKVGIQESTISRILKRDEREPAENVFDLTDANFQTILSTGSLNPFAESLADDTIWVITVYGNDGVSNMFTNASDSIARTNASTYGGTLSDKMRFARINYQTETILPTLMWIWKTPILVIATNQLQDLRFFPAGVVSPFHAPMSRLLENQSVWETIPIWTGRLSPHGSLRPYVEYLARGWAFYHYYASRVPQFLFLILSGFIMNIAIGWFHSGSTEKAIEEARSKQKQERMALQAEKAVGEAKSDSGEVIKSSVSTKEEATKKRK